MLLAPDFHWDGISTCPERSEGSPCGSLKSILSFQLMVAGTTHSECIKGSIPIVLQYLLEAETITCMALENTAAPVAQ